MKHTNPSSFRFALLLGLGLTNACTSRAVTNQGTGAIETDAGGGSFDATAPPNPMSWSGSYDFQIFGLAAECGDGARGRLDLSLSDEVPTATVSFEWAGKGAYDVELNAAEIRVYDGSAHPDPDAPNSLEELRLPLDEQGELTGEVLGLIYGSHIDGSTYEPIPVLECNDATLTGTLRPDTTRPRARIGAGETFGEGQMLPWRQFFVSASEPLGLDAASQLSLFVDDVELTDSVSWSDPADGFTYRYATLGDLARFELDTNLELRFPAGIPDSAGNVSVAETTTLPVIGVGRLQGDVSFDSDAQFGSWGDVEVIDASEAEGICEAEHCVLLRIDQAWGPGPGLALRLATGGSPTLSVRYRWLLAEELAGVAAPVLVVETTQTEGGTEFPLGAVEPLDAPVEGYTRASAWETAEIAIGEPVEEQEQGVALWATARWLYDTDGLSGYQEPEANLNAALVIEWVRVE